MSEARSVIDGKKIWSIECDKLQPHPDNPNNGDTEAIKESLEEHGQYKPLLVLRDSHVIVAGNHTWMAAMELGWTHIDCVFITATPAEALRILIADNEIAKRARPDMGRLRAILQDLNERKQLRGTGHDAETVAELVNRVRAMEHAPLDGSERPMCGECGRPMPKGKS